MSFPEGGLRYPSSEFRIPMRGYEIADTKNIVRATGFRIPMRGYECLQPKALQGIATVPNPHEGL